MFSTPPRTKRTPPLINNHFFFLNKWNSPPLVPCYLCCCLQSTYWSLLFQHLLPDNVKHIHIECSTIVCLKLKFSPIVVCVPIYPLILSTLIYYDSYHYMIMYVCKLPWNTCNKTQFLLWHWYDNMMVYTLQRISIWKLCSNSFFFSRYDVTWLFCNRCSCWWCVVIYFYNYRLWLKIFLFFF